jgi:hypothetical protein
MPTIAMNANHWNNNLWIHLQQLIVLWLVRNLKDVGTERRFDRQREPLLIFVTLGSARSLAMGNSQILLPILGSHGSTLNHSPTCLLHCSAQTEILTPGG